MRSLATELVSFSVLSFYQVYGIFYATSFLDLYRNPKSLTTSQHNKTVLVSGDEQYLFLVSFLCQEYRRIFFFFEDVLIAGLLAQTQDLGSWRCGFQDPRAMRVRLCMYLCEREGV